MRSDARVLTPEEEEYAINESLKGSSLANIAKTLNFSDVSKLLRYRERNPEFNKRVKDARILGCDILEDEMLAVADVYGSPHMARVKLEALKNVLGYRNPAVYGQRIDLNVNQTVSIKANIDAAGGRLAGLLRDVTPIDKDIDGLLE